MTKAPTTSQELRICVLLLRLTVVCAIAGDVALWAAGEDPVLPSVPVTFLASAMLGTLAIAARSLRHRRDLWRMLLLGTVAEVAISSHRLAHGSSPAHALRTIGFGFGLVAIGTIMYRAVRCPNGAREDYKAALPASMIVPAYLVASGPLLALTAVIRPDVLDGPLLLFDLGFGGAVPFETHNALLDHEVALAGLVWIYIQLPAAVAVVYALRRHTAGSSDLLVEFVVAGAVGWLFYVVFPVVGPTLAFGHGDADVWAAAAAPPVSEIPVGAFVPDSADPRNCMPSLHTAWALLVAHHARPLRSWIRWSANGFSALTIVSTVVLGFHYVVDVLLAFPLFVGVRALVGGPRMGWQPALTLSGLAFGTIGIVLAAILLVAPSLGGWSGTAHAALAWGLAAAVLGFTHLLARRVPPPAPAI